MSPTRRKPDPDAGAGDVRVLKKYPNRRLYDTRSSSYITLADVKKMVMAAEDFEVRDAKTGEEITRSILLQIILEEESAGVPMFSAGTLAQIIRFYGHAMQGMMGGLLEQNLRALADLQQRLTAPGKGLADPKAFTPEVWAQFLGAQAPLMQGLMAPYFEQSRALFEKLQEQMQKNPLFANVPGVPGRPGYPGPSSPSSGQ